MVKEEDPVTNLTSMVDVANNSVPLARIREDSSLFEWQAQPIFPLRPGTIELLWQSDKLRYIVYVETDYDTQMETASLTCRTLCRCQKAAVRF